MAALCVKLLTQMSYMGKKFFCGHLIMHRGIMHFYLPLENIIRKMSDNQKGRLLSCSCGKPLKKKVCILSVHLQTHW